MHKKVLGLKITENKTMELAFWDTRLFSLMPEGDQRDNIEKNKSSGNSFKRLHIDSVLSADFEYHIRFSEFVDFSSGIFKITLKNSIKICTQVNICTRIFCGQCFYLNILVSDLSGWGVLSNHVETRVADHLHGYFFPWATRTITH